MTPERIAELREASGATLICRTCDNRLLDDGWSVCSACGGQFARAKEMLEEIERLQDLITETGWRPASMRPPVSGEHVLVTDGESVGIGYYWPNRGWDTVDGDEFDSEHPCVGWMPLPEPPGVAR